MTKIFPLQGKYVNIHQDLIDACCTGDRKAQFAVYKLYFKAMFNTSLRIVNNHAEAEDVLQESFLDAFRRINTYTGEGSFGSWLKRIVVNRSLDHLRKSRYFIPIEDVAEEIPEEGPAMPEEDITLKVEEVKKAVAGLPDDYRVILTLILFEGYDHDEVSSLLNISNQLSRTRFCRARQKLLSVLRVKSMTDSFSMS